MRVVLCVLVGVWVAGCQFGSGLICEVKSSTGEYQQCLDATQSNPMVQERTLFETACRAGGHTLTDKACPTEKRLGGCRGASGNGDGFSVSWYYETAEFKTLQDVARKCEADQQLVDASGNIIRTNNGVCSMRSGNISTVTFRNQGDAGVTLYLKDTACVEAEKGTLAAGGIQGFPTYPGEAWVAREGTSDTNGVIRLEFVTPTTSAGLVNVP